jgi:hypothetical protein
MTTTYTNSFPYLADATYVLDNVKDGRGNLITGGSGTVSFFHDETGDAIAGQTWPSAITWNNTDKRFECEISADCVTTLGELVRGEVTIDASNGKRYVDVLKVRVRAPSSEI